MLLLLFQYLFLSNQGIPRSTFKSTSPPVQRQRDLCPKSDSSPGTFLDDTQTVLCAVCPNSRNIETHWKCDLVSSQVSVATRLCDLVFPHNALHAAACCYPLVFRQNFIDKTPLSPDNTTIKRRESKFPLYNFIFYDRILTYFNIQCHTCQISKSK